MSKLQFSRDKTLKLRNILISMIDPDGGSQGINATIGKMQSYIKVRGATQIGPLVHHTKYFLNDNEELDMEISMILQCNKFIHSVEKPYIMEATLRIPNCMYCRYIGPEEGLKFAYDKINLEAFENDIKLKGDSYTIFVDQDEEEGTIIADVFMERADQ